MPFGFASRYHRTPLLRFAASPRMSGLKLIVGLGNPGADYAATRHNAGAWFLDALAESVGARLGRDAKLHAELGKASIGGHSVWLARPTTFMNHSGRAVIALLNYYRIEPEQMLVAHDELDLPTGTARLKFDGGHGGQNGLRDIMGQLGHGRFHRLRVGIGHPGHKDRVTGWVLGRPGQDDHRAIVEAIDAARAVTDLAVAGDFEAAMRRLHVART
jgi:PTH1 family peptidyl-tRNA hydrolase